MMPSQRRHLRAVFFIFVALTALGVIAVLLLEFDKRENRRKSLNEYGTAVAQSLEQQLEQSLSSTFVLASLVQGSGDGTISDFDFVAAELIHAYGGIDSLQLAPGGVVSQIFPLAGNEEAIGHDLLNEPARRTEALAAIESGNLTLAGPFELIQGGTAVIGRLPVFLPVDQGELQFWGFTIALIRLPSLLAAANLSEISDQGYEYWLSRSNPDTGLPDVFAGSSEGGPPESEAFVIFHRNTAQVC